MLRVLSILFLFNISLSAQDCKCINCPGKIKVAPPTGDPSVQEFLYFVNGAQSNDLADPFQGVCGVSLNFKADNIFQIQMYLISPDGDTVRLIGPDIGTGFQSNFAMWNILFYPKSIVTTPDPPDFSETWTNYDPWEFFGDYQGSYHPNSGNLEDFDSGPVNGPWRLVVENFSEYNIGQIIDFSIIFCDETGIECGCLAYAGLFPPFKLIEACPGSDKLKLDINPSFNGYKPDTTIYDYTYVIAKGNNEIIGFDSIPDLTSFAPGTYKVCGFSFLASDSLKIPDANGIIKLDTLYNEISAANPDFCADLTKNCTVINIITPPAPYEITQTLCKDSCLVINNSSYCDPGVYMFNYKDKNGCDSMVVLTLEAGFPVMNEIIDTICKGEFSVLGTNFYGNTGIYTDHFKSSGGCDSMVTLKLTVLNIDVDILDPDTLNCFNSSVLLDGFEKNGNNGIVKYLWTASGGGVINGNANMQDLLVDVPGTYTLKATYTGINGKTCSDSKTVTVIKNTAQPQVTTVPDQFLCLGDEVDLSKIGIKDLNNLGGVFSFHNALPPSTANKINPLVGPAVNTTYYVFYKAGICEEIKDIAVFVNDNPQAGLKDYVSTCNSNVGGKITKIKFDSLIVSGDKTGFWVDLQMPPIGTGSFPVLDFNGVAPGTYQFAYVTQSAIPPCEDTTYVINIIVEDCQCPSIAIQGPGDICNTTNFIDLKSLEVTTNPGTWTLVGSPAGSTANITGTQLNINNTVGGIYSIQFTLNQQPPPGCDSFTKLDFKIYEPPFANVTPNISVCNADDKGQSTQIDFSSLLIGGDLSGTWKDISASGAAGNFPVLDFKNVMPGTYIFRYTTNSANVPCAETIYDVTVSVIDCACPLVEFNPAKLCADNSTVDLNTTLKIPTTGTWSIQSSPPGFNPAILNGSNITSNNSDPGKYILLFKLSSPVPGCPSDITTSITVVSSPAAIVDSLVTICNTDTNGHVSLLDLTTLLKGGDITGKWEKITFSNTIGTLPVQDFKGVNPGSYYYKYTTNSAQQPCNEVEYIVRVLVENCECPSVSIVSPGSFCNDNAIVDLDLYKITSEAGSWALVSNPGGANPAVIINNVFNGTGSDPGLYTLQFTLVNSVPGCPTFSQKALMLFGENVAKLDSDFVVCNIVDAPGQSTIVDFNKLVLSGATNGVWSDISSSGALGNFPVLDFNGVTPGDYIFRYSIPFNGACPAKQYDIFVKVISCKCGQIFTGSPGSICNNTNTLDLSSYTNPGVTLTLSSVPVGQGTNILNNQVLSVLDNIPGNYIINGSLQNEPPGCPVSKDITINIVEFKESGTGGGDLSFCEGTDSIIQLLDLINSEETGGTWIINPGSFAGFNPNTGLLDINKLKKGVYTFQYIQNNPLPCLVDSMNKSTITIIANPIADAGIDQTLGCNIQEATLGGSGNPNLINVDFNWSGTGLSSDTDPNPVTTVSGTYYLELTDKLTGCSDIDSVIVNGNISNELNADIKILNPDCNLKTGSLEIIPVSGTAPYLYSINNQVFQSSNKFSDLAPGTYDVFIQDANGCDWQSNAFIDGSASSTLSLGSDTTIYYGDSIKLNPVYTFNLTDIDSINWSNGGYLSCYDCLEPIAKPFKNTLYKLTIYTKQGCKLTADKIIRVIKQIKIFVPNIFSPDGDGINDKLEVFTDNNVAVINSFQIYDRWGERMYEAYNVAPGNTTIAWDGKFRGRKLNPGVFVYYLSAKLIDGTEYSVKGEIAIMK